jgi:putative polyhydroxyalkanoate system protein
MPDIDLRRAHALPLEEARRVADAMVERLGREFGVRGQWAGNVLRFNRPGVEGQLAVSEDEIHLTATLGFMLKAMQSGIQRAVERELDRLFPRNPR